MKRLTVLLVTLALLAACGGPEDVSHYPKPNFKTKIGKPYKIMGKWYSPRYDPSYEETGIASWYGPGFHGRSTANGEKYNQNGFSAAHTTLPLPSIVRVTNLENGKSMNLRVNDRGPFHPGRIIDLSKAAANKLGVIGTGVAKVRVKYLDAETKLWVQTRGKRGAEHRFSQGRDEYRAMNYAPTSSPHQLVRQDLTSLPMERVGTLESAPTDVIEVANLVDITPDQLAQYEASWMVQVASYADTYNAQRMMQKLSAIGEPMVQEVMVKGLPFYRVLLKPRSNKSSQFGMLSQLENRFGILDAKVVSQ